MASRPGNPPVEQPKPQPLAGKPSSGASILVSTRQKGNPILNHIKGLPWEYADIPADFTMGATTCALFLSLKYHKLHPEYIYTRIKALQGKYTLRIVLTLVDIESHEESLKELSKTSLINNVTIILAWSAQEAGRYLELFKTYEHAGPTSIKGHQSTEFVDRMTEFITVPRSVNKTDAITLVSNFGTIRTAINAQPEDISLIAGWGDKKVKRWHSAVREPFRSQRASKKVLALDSGAEAAQPQLRRAPRHNPEPQPEPEPELAEEEVQIPETSNEASKKRAAEPEMDEGVMAALAKLRQN
jgi:DNA excision repair protein ERCC-1